MANHLFYIKNTVGEYNNFINGYFSTFDKAQEALKDCCDWYRPKGTGKIYRVDIDTLYPDPVLVCEDGIIEPEFKQEYGKTSDTKKLDGLIAAAKSISDQSAQLTSDLQKHKSNLERE